MTEPCDLSAIEARRLIGAKRLSPVELLESNLKRIQATNGAVNAIVAIDEKAARKQAKAAENAVMRGDDLGLLHGLTIGVKDLEATAGLRTTWGSLLFKDHVPTEDEAHITRLRDEGAVILAKTNTPEFGAGANTKNKVYGATGNPFAPKLTCGGSSGGSAVALALGQVALATGSDYGGSLRTPAAYCGVVGYRPSPGLVPNSARLVGHMPYAVLGPMGRTIADAHLMLRATADIDKRDPYSSSDALGVAPNLGELDLAGIRVAFSADLGCAPVDEAIRRVFFERTKIFRSAFNESQVMDPDLGDIHTVFETIRGAHFVASHAEKLEKHRELLGPNIIDNTERGLKVTVRELAYANAEQHKAYRRFLDFFQEVDVLISPATSVSPFPHDQLTVTEINGEAMPTYMRWLAITYGLSMVVPAVACIPCGLDHNGLPFGIQVAGPNGSDGLVLEIAHALEHVLAGDPATKRPLADLAKLGS